MMETPISPDFLMGLDAGAAMPMDQKIKTGWNYWCLGEAQGDWSSIENLNGHFLLIGIHEKSKERHVWTNRFGTFHCYYAWDGQRAALGTNFKAVAEAASRKELDWEAMGGFFSSGFFPQDRTYYKDVKILKPASHYVFNEHGKLLKAERYWNWRHEPDLKRSYNETVEEFGSIFQEVMQNYTRAGRIAIPISGGLDSRSTVAALGKKNSDERFWAYSYGYSKDSIETKIAAQIASSAKLPFQAFTVEPYLFDRLDLILSSVEGFQDITQCRQAAVMDQIKNHADFLIAAHWGDVWMGAMLGRSPKTIDTGDMTEKILEKILKNGRQWLLENICLAQLQKKNPEDLLKGMVEEELGKLSGIADPDFRIKAFKTDNWSFRWTCSSLRMFQHAAFPRLPFYDNRIADFFCTVPTDFVRDRKLQIDYLKRFAPELAKIRWQAYDANLFEYQHFNSWLLPKRMMKKIRRLLSRSPSFQRNWEVQFLHPEGRKGLDYWLLRKGLKIHEFVSPARVKEKIDQLYQAPAADNGYAVSMLLTFSSWLEKYG